MKRRRLVAVAGVAVAALASPAAAHGALPETLLLDTRDAAPRSQPTVVAVTALEAGHAYVVTVTGTYSIVPADRWLHPAVCGTPFPAPLLPSPGVAAGPVGADAELQFARTTDNRCAGAYPRRHNRFQIDLGNGFLHPAVEGGPFGAPADRYRYGVTGRGAAPRFRVWDDPAVDNYGVLRIRIDDAGPQPPATGGRSAPAPARCLARKVLRLRIGSRRTVSRARVTVDGRRWGRLRWGRRVTARVDLRNVRRAHVRLEVRVRTRDRRVVTRARTIATCARSGSGAR